MNQTLVTKKFNQQQWTLTPGKPPGSRVIDVQPMNVKF